MLFRSLCRAHELQKYHQRSQHQAGAAQYDHFYGCDDCGKVGLGLALAVFLNRKLHLRNYLRGISFFPAIISTVAVGIVFTAILHPYGLLNQFFRALGLDFMAKNWLTDTKLALLPVCGVEIWKWSGFNMVIILAGLQEIGRASCRERV